MFSSKENVNILTSLLIEHGVEAAVVCPGSRNAPIVHNLNECGSIRCTPVTDERSAGFVAIGMAEATRKPVAVCVTSGSALLNLAPAVAEASYLHVPLVAISADRPQAWIDQLDGQTLPQADALGRFVRKAVTLPEPTNATERWHCNRLVNEALCLCTHRQPAPVHINVPISEPLFDFTTEAFPAERAFKLQPASSGQMHLSSLEEAFAAAARPMVVFGQTAADAAETETISSLARHAVVIGEPLSACRDAIHFDEVLHATDGEASLKPDLVVYVGNTIVSKRLRHFLRQAEAPTYFITADASKLPDPTMWLAATVDCGSPGGIAALLASLAEACNEAEACGHLPAGRGAFVAGWQQALATADRNAADYDPPYSQMAAVKYLEEQLDDLPGDVHVHYANSSAVRLANIYSNHYVWCNRGVNGIEGSLSTAAGFSIAAKGLVLCIIGDLSFFYDQNALWNQSLRGNLRIVLLNNHCGGIFHMLRGLEQSRASGPLVAAQHHTDARGICAQNDIGYIKATDMQEMQLGIVTLLTRESARPMLLEVATDAEDDKCALQEYYARLRNALQFK